MSVEKCKCSHEEQDKLHGKSMRVFNSCSQTSGAGKPKTRCSVCGAEHIH